MLAFAENIRFLRNKRGLSQEALALELECTRSKIASYEDGRAQPSLETLLLFSAFFKLPVDALLKNNLAKSRDETFIEIGNSRVLFPILIDDSNEDLIEVVVDKASAGYLAGYADPDYIADLPKMRLPFIPTGKHRAFPIKGDSMEPWVRSGAFVVGRYLESHHEIVSGKTYIMVTREEGLVYKRVFTDRMEEGWLKMKSDNPFYPPFDVHLNGLMEIWEYTCKIDIQEYGEEDLNLQSIMQMLRGFQIELTEIKGRLD